MDVFIGVLIALAIALLASTFRILREYERGVVFMLGRFHKVKGPGLIIVVPIIQTMERVDLRTVEIASADLTGANLAGTNLSETEIDGALLEGVIG